jgi:hypothetical protein
MSRAAPAGIYAVKPCLEIETKDLKKLLFLYMFQLKP